MSDPIAQGYVRENRRIADMRSLTKLGTGKGAYARPQVAGRHYEAVLRLSEALSHCREPEDLTTILAEELHEFLTFLQFYVVVYKENSDEVEWAVVGREKNLIAGYANVPVQERPSWQAYKTQEPFYIRDWDTDERVPSQLKKGIADQGLNVGPLVFVPLTTSHRRLGALGMSGPTATIYNSEDISFLRLIGRVVAYAISDSFNLRQAEAARLELERQNDRLQHTERELREVIETIPCMAWSATADGNAEFFNRRWLEFAGLTAEQARGTAWTTAVHPNDLKELVDYWHGILASGRPGEFEARLRRFDGEYRWLLFRATPSLDEGGTVIKWYGTNIDIEERKRAEQDLRRSEAYLAEAQRLTQTGSCAIHGTNRETLYWSEEMFRLFGFDPQQGSPKFEQWVQRIHPEDREKFKLASDRSLLKKLDCEVDFRIVKPDGTVRHIHGVGHPALSPNGELVQVIGTMIDITESMRAEEALKRSESYLAQAQRVANIGSWVFDTVRMKPVHLSTEWHRIQDFDPQNGMPTWEQRLQRIHPEDRLRYEGAFNRAIAEKSDLDAEFRILLPDSTVRYIHSVGHPVLDAFGEVSQMLGVIMDVTESRLVEQEQERLRQELAHLSHLNRVSTIGELTASLAHEIKQPIAAAVTNAHACLRLLDRARLDLPEAREAALEMTKDAMRAADIIDRVRSLYQKGSSHQEMVDINDLIQEMIVLLRDEANRHSVTTRTDLAEGLPKVIADRVQLQQALMNIMLNGIESMKYDGGELSIKSQLGENGQLLIAVADRGTGLPPERADEIFNAFFTTKPHGTGLGLAITRSILESHGGRVWATANTVQGTTFHFTLPIRMTVSA
jgi:PAS domain S-box-containing protein